MNETVFKDVWGLIVSFNFNGVGGPPSGEVIITFRPEKRDVPAPFSLTLRLGWIGPKFPAWSEALVGAYARQERIKLDYELRAGQSLPDIIYVG
jgi:hypothetical protein